MIRTFVGAIAIFLPLMGWPQTGPVIQDGKEWLQPVDFSSHSWNRVSRICNPSSGACSGSLLNSQGEAVNLTGYTWASSQDIADLLNSYIGSPTVVVREDFYFVEANSNWGAQLLGDFRCTRCAPGISNLPPELVVSSRDFYSFRVTDSFSPAETDTIGVSARTQTSGSTPIENIPLTQFFWRPSAEASPPLPRAREGEIARGGKFWLHPEKFAGYSWNEINGVCRGGECTDALSGIDVQLDDYTWAAVDDVNELFNSYGSAEPLGPGPDKNSTDFTIFLEPNLFEDFECTACPAGGISALTRQSRDAATAYLGSAQRVDGEFPAIVRSTESFMRKDLFSSDGAWFFRSVEQPALGDVPVVEALCGNALNQEQTERQRGNGEEVITCNIQGGGAKASVDPANAIIKVIADSDNRSEDVFIAQGSFTDLVTVTEGWDSNGELELSVGLEIDGIIDAAPGAEGDQASFSLLVWQHTDPVPDCLSFYLLNGCQPNPSAPYDLAQIIFRVENGRVTTIETTDGTGSVTVENRDIPEQDTVLSIPLTVTRDAPSFFVAAFGKAYAVSGAASVDFFNSAKAVFSAVSEFRYAPKNGIARNGANSEQVTDRARLSGQVVATNETPLCALVLASGRSIFTCQSEGDYVLEDLPRESDGTIRRQVYASGFVPKIDNLAFSVDEPVVLRSSGRCPNYNSSVTPASRPASAEQRHRVSGRVLVQNTGLPVRAMVLINGQFDFADGEGNYDVDFNLDSQGQFTRQVYASGFAPSIETYDASTTSLDIRMARANECR